MNIIACVKQVPDPDLPVSAYGVDSEANRITLPDDVPFVISPYDENAVEAGLQLKDQVGGRLTVVSLVTRPAEGVIRDLKQTLAMGADEAILLDDPGFHGGDSWSTAYSLAMAIKRIGEYDLVLCGLQAADWDGGQVGLGIAEILDLPAASYVTRVEPGDGCIRARRVIENGHELLELPIPCLLTVASDESLAPRIAPLPGIIKAKKREIPVWSVSDLDTDVSMVGAAGAKTSLDRLALPSFEGVCELIQGEDLKQAAGILTERLRSEKII
jgi:electron transfer flavoprotein alpha/beta subunit